MKKIRSFAALTSLIACCAVISCSKAAVVVDEPESDYYTVSLGMDGEILEVTEEPLARANGEADLYGIQVYSTPNKETAEGAKVTWTNYAYGLFDSDKNISINLLKGYRYKFVATMVVDGQEKIYNYSNKYSTPFYVSGTNAGRCVLDNKFDYQSADYFTGLADGYSNLQGPSYYNHPNLERFYGELVDYIPGKHGNKAMIKMKRVSFGAKFIAKGKLAKEGTLEVQMKDAPKVLLDLTQTDKSTSDIYTFSSLKKAYEDNNYTESIDVTINWHKNDGTIFPLGTHKVAFKRNKTTVLQIKIETENADSELGIEIDDVDMTEDDEYINIEDGEVVDTDVDTNA